MTYLRCGCRYSFPVAFAAVALTSTVGACLNYIISKAFLKHIVIGFCAQASPLPALQTTSSLCTCHLSFVVLSPHRHDHGCGLLSA